MYIKCRFRCTHYKTISVQTQLNEQSMKVHEYKKTMSIHEHPTTFHGNQRANSESSWKSKHIDENPQKTIEHLGKSKNINSKSNKNQGKSMNIEENQGKSRKILENP